MSRWTFTSESVTEGHPDKMADQISDAILDAMLEQDPASRVACETMVTTGLVVVAGEITTSGYVDIPAVVRAISKIKGKPFPVGHAIPQGFVPTPPLLEPQGAISGPAFVYTTPILF